MLHVHTYIHPYVHVCYMYSRYTHDLRLVDDNVIINNCCDVIIHVYVLHYNACTRRKYRLEMAGIQPEYVRMAFLHVLLRLSTV